MQVFFAPKSIWDALVEVLNVAVFDILLPLCYTTASNVFNSDFSI